MGFRRESGATLLTGHSGEATQGLAVTAARRNPTRVQPLALPRRSVDGGRRTGSEPRSVAAAGSLDPVYFAGPENRLVVSAVSRLLNAADKPAPGALTIIGPPGSGKSLLASGVEAAWVDACGADAVVGVTGVNLRRQLERALNADHEHPGTVTALADRLAGVRLLIVEDLEGLANSRPAVELFTSTIDRLAQNGATMMITAGKPLGEIEGLNARLIGRLATGLTIEVAAPAEAAREELLVAALQATGSRIDASAAADLAAWLPADARRVLSTAKHLHQRFGTRSPIGPHEARVFVAEATVEDASTPLADIATITARYYAMPLRQLRSSSRKAPVVLARAVTIYLARQLTPLSYDEIGRYLGGRDHTTVMHNFNRISKGLSKDRALRSAIEDLFRRLGRADLIATPLATPAGEREEQP